MKKHAEFLIARVAHASQTEMQPENLEVLFSTTWVALLDLAVKSGSHLSQASSRENHIYFVEYSYLILQSHEVWDVVRDWQLEMLESAPAEKK